MTKDPSDLEPNDRAAVSEQEQLVRRVASGEISAVNAAHALVQIYKDKPRVTLETDEQRVERINYEIATGDIDYSIPPNSSLELSTLQGKLDPHDYEVLRTTLVKALHPESDWEFLLGTAASDTMS